VPSSPSFTTPFWVGNLLHHPDAIRSPRRCGHPAVIGYSLNDTVVVFDRIRERLETNRRLPPDVVLDQSINQTLSRTS